uniref:GAE domain-containing protein n=1 Tax=Heterorhabditis bacteriophora TaxID=37862 RepID=A0A1I7WWW8_HETBA
MCLYSLNPPSSFGIQKPFESHSLRLARTEQNSHLERLDLLGADLTESTFNSERSHLSDISPVLETDDIFDTNHKESITNDFPDVPFIGFDRMLTPALPRRSPMKNIASSQPILSSLSALIDGDLFSTTPDHPQAFKSLKPTLNDLCSSLLTNSISNDFPTSILPETISLDPKTVQLAVNPPSAVLDKQNINILLYCSNFLHITGMKTYVLAIFNTHVEACHNIQLIMGTTNKKVSIRLQSGESFDLLGVSPCRPISTVYRTLCILPLGDVKEVDVDFSLSYTQNYDRSITGNFILTLE